MTAMRLAFVLLLLVAPSAVAGDLERGQEAMEKMDYDLAIACFNAYILYQRAPKTCSWLCESRQRLLREKEC
jgi:hypothetical protein